MYTRRTSLKYRLIIGLLLGALLYSVFGRLADAQVPFTTIAGKTNCVVAYSGRGVGCSRVFANGFER